MARTVKMKHNGPGNYRGRHERVGAEVVGEELHLEAGEEFLVDEATALRLEEHHGAYNRFSRIVEAPPAPKPASEKPAGEGALDKL